MLGDYERRRRKNNTRKNNLKDFQIGLWLGYGSMRNSEMVQYIAQCQYCRDCNAMGLHIWCMCWYNRLEHYIRQGGEQWEDLKLMNKNYCV